MAILNYRYRIGTDDDHVIHVACNNCLPSGEWLRGHGERYSPQGLTCDRCEYCGHVPNASGQVKGQNPKID